MHLWGDDEVTGPISVEVEAPLGDIDDNDDNVDNDDNFNHYYHNHYYYIITIIVEVEAPLGKPPVFYRKSSSWAELFVGIRNQFS